MALAIFAAGAALGVGCNGDDGDTIVGPAGPAGTPGTTSPTIRTLLDPLENMPGFVLAITSVAGATGAGGTYQSGDTLRVTFTVKTTAGVAIPINEVDGAAMWMSGPTFNYQHVLPPGPTSFYYTDIVTASVKNADGSYTYTFPAAIPTTYPPPLNDTTKFTDGELAGTALLAGTYTVAARAYKNYTFQGEGTARDVGFATSEFLYGAAGTITPREVVKVDNCNRCHVTIQMHGGTYRSPKLCVTCHTAGAEDRNSTAVGDVTPGTIEFKVMIHKLHNGEHLPSVLGVATDGSGNKIYTATPQAYVMGGSSLATAHDWSELAFPVWPAMTNAMPKDQGYSALSSANKALEDEIRKGVTECNKCHGDPDGTGPLTAPAQGGLAFSQPSRRVCGSCHDDVNFANSPAYVSNGQTMGTQSNDSGCTAAGCHTTSGTPLSVTDAHLHPMSNATLNPGVNFAVTTLAGGTGTGGNFQAGDSPQLTFTVTDNAATNVPLGSLDGASALVVGPTTNRQIVMPYPTPNGVSISPFDFAGRLASSSTSGKGAMSKVVPTGTPVTETLTVDFTSATAFSVTGSASGSLGSSALPASPSTNPSGSSLSGVWLSPSAVAETVTVGFTSATNFTVTGSVSGSMGSGTLPSSASASVRFAGTTLAFNMSVGATVFTSGNSIYMTVFKGAVANPVVFAIVAGRTSFATGDRLYYEHIAPASSYTYKVPMDVAYEFLGDGNNVVGQTLTAGNLPVYWGRQTLWERTALVGTATTLSAASLMDNRYVDIAAIDALLAVGDVVVLEDGVANQEEYAAVGRIETTGGLRRIWFRTPLRYAHASGSGFQEATLTFRQEGANYTLASATGVVTSVVAFGNGNAIVMTYRTDGRFGWYRRNGDTLQTTYRPSINDSPTLDEVWGEWTGKAFVDGTYTVGLWGYRNIELGLAGEAQTYRGASAPANKDFLYGSSATTVAPYALISSGSNCQACHTDVMMHGSSRRGPDTCFLCHGTAGSEDWPLYNTVTSATPAGETPGVTINFRTMLHKIHRGADLAYASTYDVGGNGGGSHLYEHVEFPAMPGKTKHCDKCHGTGNTAWNMPSDRDHPAGQTLPVREWRAVCGSCHDASYATGHFDLMTSSGGQESCGVCHGTGRPYDVVLMHKNR